MSGWVLNFGRGIYERCQGIEWRDTSLLGSQSGKQINCLRGEGIVPHDPWIVGCGIGKDAIEEHIIAHAKPGSEYGFPFPKQPIPPPILRSGTVSDSESWCQVVPIRSSRQRNAGRGNLRIPCSKETERDRGVFIPQSKIHVQVSRNLDIILEKVELVCLSSIE